MNGELQRPRRVVSRPPIQAFPSIAGLIRFPQRKHLFRELMFQFGGARNTPLWDLLWETSKFPGFLLKEKLEMNMKRIAWLTLVVALAVATPSFALPHSLYYNNFDGTQTVGLGATFTYTPAGAGITGSIIPPFGNFLRNRTSGTTEFLFTNLPTHTHVDIGYLMMFLDSWDSRNGSCCTPDNLDLYVDDILVGRYTYNNALGSIKDIGGGTVIFEYVQYDDNSYYNDVVVDMSGDAALSFGHTGSSLKVGFVPSGVGFQYGTDESWGIDNLDITLGGVTARSVPEPGSLISIMLGLGGIASAIRRKRG
jgi:hypothetical protein